MVFHIDYKPFFYNLKLLIMRYLISLILIFLFLSPTFSQITITPKLFYGIPQGTNNDLPQGVNDDLPDGTIIDNKTIILNQYDYDKLDGYGVEFTVGLKSLPNLHWGGSFTKINFRTLISLANYFSNDASNGLNIIDDAIVSNSLIYNYQGLVKYFVVDKDKRLRPFFQIQGGGSTFSIVENSGINDISKFREIFGTTWIAGLSGGLNVNLWKCISLQFNLGYNLTGNMETRISTFEESGDPAEPFSRQSNLINSRVNHIFSELGIAFTF